MLKRPRWPWRILHGEKQIVARIPTIEVGQIWKRKRKGSANYEYLRIIEIRNEQIWVQDKTTKRNNRWILSSYLRACSQLYKGRR